MSFYWEHDEETSQRCPTATLMGGETWVCLAHGAPVHFVKLEVKPTERIVDNVRLHDPVHDYNIPLELVNVSQVPLGTTPHHAQGYKSPMRQLEELQYGLGGARTSAEYLAEKRAQYAPMWEQVIRLAYSDQVKFIKDDPTANAIEAMHAVVEADAKLQQVGWYCAGGHELSGPFDPEVLESRTATTAPANLRFDDPCEHGVPVYVLVDNSPTTTSFTIDRSGDHPDVDHVKNLVGARVRVTVHSQPDVTYVGKLVTVDTRNTIWVDQVGEPGSPEVMIPWDDLRTCEEL